MTVIDWLLDADPAIRWQVMRDLTHEPQDVIAAELHLLFLRDSSGARLACTIVSFGALLGLLGAWALVGRGLARFSSRQLLVLAISWALPLLVAPPLFSGDIYAYVGQGHLVVNHIDPYIYGPGDYEPTSKWSYNVDGVWRFSPAPYGPLWLWLTAQAVGIPENHLVVSIYLIRGLAVVGFVLMAWAVVRLARIMGIPAQRALWLTLLNPLLLLHGLPGSHNDILMIGLMMTGLAVAASHRSLRGVAAGSALVTLAVMIKAPAIVALPFVPLLAGRGERRWVQIAITAVTAGALAEGVAAATRLGWGWVSVLGDQGERPALASLAWGVRKAATSTTHALLGSSASDTVDTGVEALCLALLAVALIGTWLLAFAGRLEPLTAAGVALLSVFFLSFSVQPWYLAWGLVPLACTSSPRRAAFLASFSGALCLYLLPGGRSWIRPPLYGVPVLLALLVSVAVMRWFANPTTPAAPEPERVEAAAN